MPVDEKDVLDPKKIKFINKLADFVIRRELGVVAVMYIESMRPLHRLSSNLITFFEPFLNIVFAGENLAHIRSILEEEKYMEFLLERIESDKLSTHDNDKNEENKEEANLESK